MKFIAQLLNPVNIIVNLNDCESRPTISSHFNNVKYQNIYVFKSGDTIDGKIVIQIPQHGKPLNHKGIQVELLGQICFLDDSSANEKFLYQIRILEDAALQEVSKIYEFKFDQVSMPHESFDGVHVKINYQIIVTVKGIFKKITHSLPIHVYKSIERSIPEKTFHIAVGITGTVGIDIELEKSSFAIDDILMGTVSFNFIQSRLKNMYIILIQTETTNIGTFESSDHSRTILDLEVMNGSPVKGDVIPFRFFLANLNLVPTILKVENKFSVRYYLKIAIYDDFDRRYFKKEEIFLFRKAK